MNVAAAFIFFTRLPLWRWIHPAPEAYKHVVPYWPIVGWLTAGVSAGVLYAASLVMPAGLAVGAAIAARLLLTGALHEDGLADFFDGFGGGGSDRTRILAIMKDSHIGTYGVISLIVYLLFYAGLLAALPVPLACQALLCGDPLAKGTAAQIVNLLPYARTEQQSKAKVVYDRMSLSEVLVTIVFGVLPLLFLMHPFYWGALLGPVAMFLGLVALMKKRIGGYTGDCCGATCLLCEWSFYVLIVILYTVDGTYLGPTYFG